MKVLRENYLCVLLFLFSFDASVSTRQSRNHCQITCGHLNVEFPFGTSPDCIGDDRFLLSCDEKGKAFLKQNSLQVVSVSLDGELEVLSSVLRACSLGGDTETNVRERIPDGGFAFSDKNDLTFVGCDVNLEWGFLTQGEEAIGDCNTYCDSSGQMDDSCTGQGCCKTQTIRGSHSLDVLVSDRSGSEHSSKLNPCTSVFVVKRGHFFFSPTQDLTNLRNVSSFPVLLEWNMVGKCQQDNYCGEKSNCNNIFTADGFRYTCKCMKGFEGNPYVQHGCKDIDECKMNIHSCGKHETCKNLLGSFRCKKGTDWKTIILVSVIGFLLFLIGVGCLMLRLKLWKRAKLRERWFEENGGTLLVQRLLDSGGESSHASIQIFKEEEIKAATNGYHETRIVGEGGQGVVYRGTLSDGGVEVAIKKARDWNRIHVAQFINEVVLLSRINHPNVVRLLGCCLETQVPLLVYEYVSGGTLYDNLFGSSLSWSDRLRIATEIAESLSYLHFSVSVPIVHRDVKPANILLDETLSARLSDFGASRLVPENSEQLTTLVRGTWGYLDPEYLHTSTLSERTDIYSYGVVLMELVSGEKALCFNRPQAQKYLVGNLESALRENRLSEVVDQRVVNAENQGVMYQAALLAIRCTRVNGEERPDMRQVAAELQGLRASGQQGSGPSVPAFEIEESN